MNNLRKCVGVDIEHVQTNPTIKKLSIIVSKYDKKIKFDPTTGTNYILVDFNGKIKWIKFFKNLYVIDPQCLTEFFDIINKY